MNVMVKPGPIHGIDPEKPLSEYALEELRWVWDEIIRNRNPLDVIGFIEGRLQAEMPSEFRLLEVYRELFSRGDRPFESVHRA